MLPNGFYGNADDQMTIYHVVNGVKMHVPNPDVFNQVSGNWDAVQWLPWSTLAQLQTGPPVGSTSGGSGGGVPVASGGLNLASLLNSPIAIVGILGLVYFAFKK